MPTRPSWVNSPIFLVTLLRQLWKNETAKNVIVICLVPLLLISCIWFGLPKLLNTEVFPALTVVSGSMCISAEPCSHFSHTFERTLHKGDFIIIKGVDAKDLKTNYPNSDIIVFRDPEKAVKDSKANIVHRIIDTVEVNGKLYFYTKGDGNGYPNVWPQELATGNRDNWRSTADDPNSTYDGAISKDYVYGKVIMRIPWIGSIAMFFQQHNILRIILALFTILFIIFVFVIPVMKKRVWDKNTIDEPPFRLQN